MTFPSLPGLPRHACLVTILLVACGGGSGSQAVFPGTIEVNESDAAPLVGGRVIEVRVIEGDSVLAGDTLAVLTQATLPAAVEERRARVAAARARLADLRRGSRAPELERAEADLAAAETETDRSARDFVRAERLVKDGVIPAQEFDRVKTAAEGAARRRDAARATLQLLREGSRADQIQAAEAELASAVASLKGARADLAELAVTAAVSGVVLSRHTDPGEVVPAGTPIVTIGEVSSRWVRVYLPASLVARLPIGSEAAITFAEPPSRRVAEPPVQGRLQAVNPRAEFTPRAALTEEERSDLLFAARIELLNPPPGFRPGLPVNVRFSAPAPR
jgi:HlyD family secretion protein